MTTDRNLCFVIGLATGIGLAYVFDPRSGGARRALARDQVRRAARKSAEGFDATARDLANRASGQVARMRARMGAETPADDVLVERVRAALGRVVTHPRAVDVSADGGHIRLCGPILASEVDRLLDTVAAVPGVAGVSNELEVHHEAGNIPSLQGGREGFYGTV